MHYLHAGTPILIDDFVDCWSSAVRLHPPYDVRRTHSAGLASNFPSIFEKYHRRNTPNLKLCSGGLFGFGVEFRQSGRGLQSGRSFLKGRRHHFAGAAPFGPEIDNNGDIIATDMFLEIAVCKFYRPRNK